MGMEHGSGLSNGDAFKEYTRSIPLFQMGLRLYVIRIKYSALDGTLFLTREVLTRLFLMAFLLL